MNNSITNRFNLVLFAFAIGIALVATLSGVMATRAIEDDGRLNLVNHLGGDAVFCVGADMTASGSFVNGGIRLLSASGQQLFFVPAATINAVPEMPVVDTRIAQGWGTYGVVELWRLTTGEFSLIGQDEHGKQFIFTWTGCTPIGPIPYENHAPEADEPDCDVIGNDGNDGNDGGSLAPDDCGPVATEEPEYSN